MGVVVFSSFWKMVVIFGRFHSFGTLPADSKLLNIIVNGVQITSVSSCRTLGCIPSDLVTF